MSELNVQEQYKQLEKKRQRRALIWAILLGVIFLLLLILFMGGRYLGTTRTNIDKSLTTDDLVDASKNKGELTDEEDSEVIDPTTPSEPRQLEDIVKSDQFISQYGEVDTENLTPEDIENMLAVLEWELDKNITELNKTQEQINTLTEQIVSYEEQITFHRDQIEGLEQQGGTTNQIQSHEQAIRSLESQIIAIRRQISEYHFQIEEIRFQIIKITQQIDEYKNAIPFIKQQYDSIRAQITEKEAQIESLQQQIDSLSPQSDDYQGQVDSLQAQIDDLQGQITDLQVQIVTLDQQIRDYYSQINALYTQVIAFFPAITRVYQQITIFLPQTILWLQNFTTGERQIDILKDQTYQSLRNTSNIRVTIDTDIYTDPQTGETYRKSWYDPNTKQAVISGTVDASAFSRDTYIKLTYGIYRYGKGFERVLNTQNLYHVSPNNPVTEFRFVINDVPERYIYPNGPDNPVPYIKFPEQTEQDLPYVEGAIDDPPVFLFYDILDIEPDIDLNFVNTWEPPLEFTKQMLSERYGHELALTAPVSFDALGLPTDDLQETSEEDVFWVYYTELPTGVTPGININNTSDLGNMSPPFLTKEACESGVLSYKLQNGLRPSDPPSVCWRIKSSNELLAIWRQNLGNVIVLVNTNFNSGSNSVTVSGQIDTRGIQGLVPIIYYYKVRDAGNLTDIINNPDPNYLELGNYKNSNVKSMLHQSTLGNTPDGSMEDFSFQINNLEPDSVYRFQILEFNSNPEFPYTNVQQFFTQPASISGGGDGGIRLANADFSGLDISGAGDCSGIAPCCGYDRDNNGKLDEYEVCGYKHIIELIHRFFRWILTVGIFPILVISMTYAGWLLLTSHNRPQRRTEARNFMINFVIGLLLVILAWFIVASILKFLGVDNAYILLDI